MQALKEQTEEKEKSSVRKEWPGELGNKTAGMGELP